MANLRCPDAELWRGLERCRRAAFPLHLLLICRAIRVRGGGALSVNRVLGREI
jgi:hypothetical protein